MSAAAVSLHDMQDPDSVRGPAYPAAVEEGAGAPPARIWVRWSDDRQRIRKWSSTPFPEADAEFAAIAKARSTTPESGSAHHG